MKFERLLAIETSSAQLSLAVGSEEKILKSYQSPLAWRHAESLMSAMRKLLAQVRWPVQTLEGVIVSTGPGSFTGIRIGLASARALGQALQIPVVGVSSLETMAFAQGNLPRATCPGQMPCPIIDALRGEVFTALFKADANGTVRRVWEDQRMPRVELEKKLTTLKKKGSNVTLLEGVYPDARALLKLGAPRLVKAGPRSYQNVLPTYLRLASAQERLPSKK